MQSAKRNELEPTGKKRKIEGHGRYNKEWESSTFEKGIFSEYVQASTKGPGYAHCIPCKKDIKVSSSGIYDLRMHFQTKQHDECVSRSKSFKPLNRHFQVLKPSDVKESSRVTQAEILLCQFIAEHNLPPLIADHFSDLIKAMFPDCETAQKFACKRTKTTQIIKGALAPHYTDPVVERCRKAPFALMIDESNDQNDDKRLCILIRAFEGDCTKSRMLDMPKLKGGTAAIIFDAVSDCMSNLEIPWTNLIAFASDNCNVMIGVRNSVLSRLKEKNAHIFSIGCICHLANLCVKSATKQLHVSVDDLFVDLYYFFEHSSKRKEHYKEFQLFTGVDHLQIIKHCPTRWLSLEKVCDRVLNQMPALKSYFASHPDVEKLGKVKSLHERLHNPLTQATLQFLAFVLPVLNKFNTVFQAEESKIGSLIPEMDRLLRKLLSKFVLMKHIRDCSKVTELQFKDRHLQHDDENIAVGVSTRTFLATENEMSPKMKQLFFSSVRSFYEAAISKMVDKFPFDDKVLPDLVVLDVLKRDDLTYDHIVKLSSHFTPDVDIEELKEEWDDFRLMPSSEIEPLIQDEHGMKKIDELWGNILAVKTALARLRFPQMAVVYTALLSLPHSNADCERAFSMVRKIHTDFRKSMTPDTLSAFLKVKINCDLPCFKARVTESLIAKSKSATKSYNEALEC